MAVDPDGYITRPERREVQPAFADVVTDVTARLSGGFPGLIHSIYLYGSIAEGRAIPGKSDLDVTIIFNHQPDAVASEDLATLKSALEHNHPVVSKIDFDCGVRDQVLHPSGTLSWGYWLRHHCVCVYGEDLSEKFPTFTPSKAIAIAVNGDFREVTGQWFAQLKATTDDHERLLLQRAIARKLIRSTSILRGEQDKDWPETLNEHLIKFTLRFPAFAEEMNFLMTIANVPDGNLPPFEKRALDFAGWLETTFRKTQD